MGKVTMRILDLISVVHLAIIIAFVIFTFRCYYEDPSSFSLFNKFVLIYIIVVNIGVFSVNLFIFHRKKKEIDEQSKGKSQSI
jgi:hypothetical protein